MFRPMLVAAPIVLALAAASCRTGPSDERRDEWEKGGLIHRTLVGYHTIMSAHSGKVGYVKVYDVTEGGGNPYPWKYVYDVNWKELGFVTQFGSAMRYHEYPPSEQAAQKLELRGDWMPSDSLENNVMRMLGIDITTDRLTFPPSTHEDIAGDANLPHLAGPGVTPAKAPTK
jgi:hypothetical protein